MKHFVMAFFALFVLAFTSHLATAQTTIDGVWFNAEKTGKIQIYKATDGKYYGKIVWLSEPNDNSGKPRKDMNNPNKTLKTKPLVGLVNLKGFDKISETKFENGTIYDPKNGKTYSCIMTLKDSKTLDVRGYIGIAALGRTTTFTRAN